MILKLPFLFKEEGFGNSSCYSYLQVPYFSNQPPCSRIFSWVHCIQCVSCCILHGALWQNHFRLLLAPESTSLPSSAFCSPFHYKGHHFIQAAFHASHTDFFLTFSCVIIPIGNAFLKSVIQALCSSLESVLAVHFRHICSMCSPLALRFYRWPETVPDLKDLRVDKWERHHWREHGKHC